MLVAVQKSSHCTVSTSDENVEMILSITEFTKFAYLSNESSLVVSNVRVECSDEHQRFVHNLQKSWFDFPTK